MNRLNKIIANRRQTHVHVGLKSPFGKFYDIQIEFMKVTHLLPAIIFSEDFLDNCEQRIGEGHCECRRDFPSIEFTWSYHVSTQI